MKNLDIDEINLSLVNIDINYINKPNNIKQTKLKNISKDMHYKKIFAKKLSKNIFIISLKIKVFHYHVKDLYLLIYIWGQKNFYQNVESNFLYIYFII